jgi:FkbM family methyltransferase
VKIFLELGAEVVAIEPQDECVQFLKQVFRKNRHLNIVKTALGEYEGEAEIMISDSHTLSSMSPEWIRAVRESGRFSEYLWEEKQKIQLTTLDRLIKKYGQPDFVKIDVEGSEYQVIRGLSKSVSLNCIDYLMRLSEIKLNYSLGESMQFSLETWIVPEEMKELLSNLSGEHNLFGDVYIKSV